MREEPSLDAAGIEYKIKLAIKLERQSIAISRTM